VTAYVAIYNAVKGQKDGLCRGRLHDGQRHCAIGSYFNAAGKDATLPTPIIEEVATINDTCVNHTPKQRRAAVMKWLRWKLKSLGYQ
jgi:hypothetical protein